MIVPYLAGTTWLTLLVPEQWRVYFLAAAIAFAIWRFRASSWLVAAGLLITIGSIAWNTHPAIARIAVRFETRAVTVVAVEDGAKLTKVRAVKISGCPDCEGAYGQYLGALSAGEVARGVVMLRPAYSYGEFVLRGKLSIAHQQESRKASYLERARGISPDAKSLVLGLAVGDTSTYRTEFLANLKALSLTHLSAVSGANCAIVVGAVFWLLSFLTSRRWLRTSLAIVALIFYVQLVGPQASVLRAALMAGVVLLAVSRGVWPIAALSWAVLLLLWVQPNYAHDYGFTLSVCATAAILILAPALVERFKTRMPKPAAVALAVTVAAQLWCMPILLGLQGGVPTYAVVANLLSEPVVPIVTVLGISAAFLPIPGL